jgi:DNA-binding MarR family transcriptional regulator
LLRGLHTSHQSAIGENDVLEKKLKRLIVTDPGLVRDALLTEDQAHVVKTIMEYDYPTISTKELSEIKGISIQNASSQLAKLWRKGYLKREERICESGGIVYRYSSAI